MGLLWERWLECWLSNPCARKIISPSTINSQSELHSLASCKSNSSLGLQKFKASKFHYFGHLVPIVIASFLARRETNALSLPFFPFSFSQLFVHGAGRLIRLVGMYLELFSSAKKRHGRCHAARGGRIGNPSLVERSPWLHMDPSVHKCSHFLQKISPCVYRMTTPTLCWFCWSPLAACKVF